MGLVGQVDEDALDLGLLQFVRAFLDCTFTQELQDLRVGELLLAVRVVGAQHH